MKISTRGRYALRMFLDLAEHQHDGYIALKDIANRQNISKKYLEQIVSLVNKSGYLQSNRGFQGGYRLAKPPSQYTVGDILRFTEGSLAPTPCVEEGDSPCSRGLDCATYFVWQGLYQTISQYLDSITLQNILEQAKALGADNYII